MYNNNLNLKQEQFCKYYEKHFKKSLKHQNLVGPIEYKTYFTITKLQVQFLLETDYSNI